MRRKNYNPQFKVNLVQLFNRAYAREERAVRSKLRSVLSSSNFKRQFGRAVIDRIIERTSQENIDRGGKPFAGYSQSYIQSDSFKIYGKNPASVNLELSGEMLSSMKSVDTAQTIIIEMIGKENKAKAHGHVYGIKSKRGRVKRDFLGLPDEDLENILIEQVEQFRIEEYDEASGSVAGQSFTDVFGQIGSQPEFGVSVRSDDILALLLRNLNGQ